MEKLIKSIVPSTYSTATMNEDLVEHYLKCQW